MRPLALGALLATASVPLTAAAAPTTVTLVGDFQSGLGCASNDDPTCAATQLTLDASDGVWQKAFTVPAGATWHYKVAIDGKMTEAYPAAALTVTQGSSDGQVKFYYDPVTHYVRDNVARIAVAPGSFQSELGCPDDWQPDCLKSWLQDPDGDGIFTFTTTQIPPGSYEAKVAINESWDENYGDNGSNVAFTVPNAGEEMVFKFNSLTKKVTIKSANAAAGDILLASAHWLTPDTLAWSPNLSDLPSGEAPAGSTYEVHYQPDGSMRLNDTGIQGGTSIALQKDPSGLSAELKERFPNLKDAVALKLPASEVGKVPDILKGQIAVTLTSPAGKVLDATSVQLPGVLDALDTYTGELGVSFSGGVPTLRVWAPTARKVSLLIFDSATAADPSQTVPMQAGEKGVWSAQGNAAWKGKFYLYEVDVYVRKEQAVKTNRVTDPYSVSLSTNSTRSQIVDLNDETLQPQGWSKLAKPALLAPEDIVLYELHVRDFSINDSSVPENERGTFKAFTENSNGTKHLERLAKAGVTHVHLLPVFDIATINENRVEQQSPAIDPAWAPDSDQQRTAVAAQKDTDGFNWGYDPYHYTVPEGSYSTDPNGTPRIVEFREMVQAINQRGLRVVMDVVYNHTNAAGQDEKSVLDRIVPGYYHRLGSTGNVETSTCCQNTATEHAMMEKLMVDSLVTWAKQYKVDGFRFDLMGHHMKSNMLKVRAALDALTLEKDGVDGKAIYIYGEGWNFGEVQDNARGVNATQLNMAGTGIGTFSDRLRDAARGGSPFPVEQKELREQGFINGLFYDPNDEPNASLEDQRSLLLQHMDRIRVGLAGNLKDYTFTNVEGVAVKGSDVKYGGSPAGYTSDPQEVINYVSAHDNETLFDAVQMKAPSTADMDARVRMHNMGMSLVALGQGIPFFHAGDELLRSKSLDRNSFNSGDWFNKLDWTYQSDNWGVGLPPSGDNGGKWTILQKLLENPALKPTPAHIQRALEHFEEMIRIRKSTGLFRLETGAEVQQRVHFLNTGPQQIPGLIVMHIEGDRVTAQGAYRDAVVLFNATNQEQHFSADNFKDMELELHPVLKESTDPVVKTSSFAASTGTFTVPARTTAVFMGKSPVTGPGPKPSSDTTDGCGCSGGGSAAFSAFALLLGLVALRRPRRREQ